MKLNPEPKTVSAKNSWMVNAKNLTIDDLQKWLLDIEDRICKLELGERQSD